MLEKINNDLKDVLKNKDKFRLSVLRMVKSALQLDAINKMRELTDDDVIGVLKKQVKQRADSLEEYKKFGKEETVKSLQQEIDIISAYLPEEASMEEIISVIDAAFQEIKPTSMKEMSLIMKYATDHLKNADMATVSKIVRERLVK